VDVPTVLDQLPTDTTIIALDENNQPLPLATEEAAAVIQVGDPTWCPLGKLPGDPSCTPPQTSFNDLINTLKNNKGTYSGPGTIYVAYNYVSTADGGKKIIFDYNSMALTHLTVQGGWDGNNNGFGTIVGNSTIISDGGVLKAGTLEFWDWGSTNGSGVTGAANLTINNIIYEGGNNGNTGLYIGKSNAASVSGDVALNNVQVTNTDMGAYVYANGNVSINGGSYSRNHPAGKNPPGLQIGDNGIITQSQWGKLDSSNNWVSYANGSVGGNATINSAVFSNNTRGSGLITYAKGHITLFNAIASNNYADGAYLNNSAGSGSIAAANSTFNNNGLRGLYARTSGTFTLVNVFANENGFTFGGSGVVVDSATSILVNCSTLDSNFDYGLVNNAGVVSKFNSVDFGGNLTGRYTGAATLGRIAGCRGKEDLVKPPTVVTSHPYIVVVVTPYPENEKPGDLPRDDTFVQGLFIELMLGNLKIAAAPNGAPIFVDIPADAQGKTLTVLYWNGDNWETVDSLVIGKQITFKVTTPGKYMLVTP
jgi:hypothetical protein